MEPDVLVAGAGPVGLALACALLQHGVSVRVLDRAQAPATTSRANFVHARGSEVLDRLDALSGLPEESVRAMTITNYAGDRPMMRVRFGDPGLHTAAPPMVISQARVEARLRDRLAELGGRPEWGCALVGAGQDADGVTAALGDGRTVRARWLVGCDGTGSTVRELAGIVERMRHILPGRTHGLGGRLLDASWASLFSVHRRLADTYRQGRILLAGDSAHAHAPFGGQGMLTGIGDAENLAWKLALVIGGLAGERLLHTYEAERRPLATQVLRGSTAATRMNIAAGPVGRFLRDRVMVPAFNLPVLQRWTTYTTSQLWVSYRRGPLGGRGSRPRSGDRIADVACVRADGIRTRLHAELRGRWAVLADASLFEAARRRLGEHVVHLRPVDPLPAMLVRPDAHLACTGDPTRWLDGALA
ncbi:FAD-dependent monooxygenase [Nonomuraea fuscirosea]|uniref:FAD-dependent monooxygenase n=1 Tax=Nonomuraea fuscirosea TaxID=1291556 RepID=UPI00343473BC